MVFAYAFLALGLTLFCPASAVLTDIVRYESTTGAPVVLMGDMHSASAPLTPALRAIARQQTDGVQEIYSGYTKLIERPVLKDNNVLGLLGGQDLENRGPALQALYTLSMRLHQMPLPEKTDTLLIRDMANHCETVMRFLKQKFVGVAALRPFEDDIAQADTKLFALHDHLMARGAPQEIASLYHYERPLELLNTIHDAWSDVFELNALYELYSHSRHNNVAICVGTRHRVALSSLMLRLDGFAPIYRSINRYRESDPSSIASAALSTINLKQGAGHLAPHIGGTLCGVLYNSISWFK